MPFACDKQFEAVNPLIHFLGDSLNYQNNQRFSTKDKDHDNKPGSCAKLYIGAWWYKYCHRSNLNGKYLGGETDVYAAGVVWEHWKGFYYSLKHSEMKIRAK